MKKKRNGPAVKAKRKYYGSRKRWLVVKFGLYLERAGNYLKSRGREIKRKA